MNRFPTTGRGALLPTLLAASCLALAQASLQPAWAQAIVQQPTPNADRLSEQMRILATSPNDLNALIEAGRLSTRLGDPQASVQFFARAEKVAPGDPRVLAGRASALLSMERPGEAMRLFAAAERAGLAPRYFAADRGLAFDLLGYPTNAQRDYRLALSVDRDDEIVRRLALSLGITGDVRAANQLLDPLLRQSDRAAWRVHACVLAMQGDAAGADRIAATMLPGFGTQLAPFFRRLPSLSPADRAFAVHFGRLGTTPARIADARLAPPIVPAPRAEAPVAVAAATTAVQPAQTATRTRKLSRRERREAAAAARRETEARQREAELAAARKAEADRVAEAARVAEVARAAEAARLAQVARAAEAARTAAAAETARRVEAERVAQAQRAAEAARLAEAQRLAEAARLADAQRAAAAAAAQEARDVAAAEPRQVASAPQPPAPARSDAAAAATDTTLATIIRNLTIPATELGVAPLPSAAPAPVTPAATAPAAPPVRVEPARPEPRPTPAKAAAARETEKPAAKEPAAKGKDAAAKPGSAKAAKDDPKAATAKGKTKTPAKPDPVKRDPARTWVQVAGGANKADLPKAYRALGAKAAALKGRAAWTTPLRATNRLLVGPFKTDDEAQAFVNTLAKQGLSAFVWASEPGQKIEQLPK